MNLELLSPFGRQVPDRIDSTIELPSALHFRTPYHPEEKKGKGGNNSGGGPNNTAASAAVDTEYKSAYIAAFNRRGTYIAVGYGSGTVAVHNALSRTLTALYRHADLAASPVNPTSVGISSVSWSRRSRTLLTGSAGDAVVRLLDTSHPYGPEEANAALQAMERQRGEGNNKDKDNADADDTSKSSQLKEGHAVSHGLEQTQTTSFVDADDRFYFSKDTRQVDTITVSMGRNLPDKLGARLRRPTDIPSDARGLKKYHAVTWNFAQNVSGSLHVNPRIPTAGMAVLEDGSLVLFWIHDSIWVKVKGYEKSRCLLVPIWGEKEKTTSGSAAGNKNKITCAAFDPHGDRVYAATENGRIMGFDVTEIWKALQSCAARADSASARAEPQQQQQSPPKQHAPITIPRIEPHFCFSIPGASSSSWHLVVSRNGKFFVLNSADGALRLFPTAECWEKKKVDKPTHVFQDVVSKVKFASCDMSGDGEYVVGGANGEDQKYELYIWNTTTGVLMDKLTGPTVQLFSVAWHPVRSFVAVSTSDGLIDVWGPRIDWTSFAPDFQSLPRNVEYVECEDELDVDSQGESLANKNNRQKSEEESENAIVDVCTVEPVPVFQSDSEPEEEVFTFETRISNLMLGRRFTKSAQQLEE